MFMLIIPGYSSGVKSWGPTLEAGSHVTAIVRAERKKLTAWLAFPHSDTVLGHKPGSDTIHFQVFLPTSVKAVICTQGTLTSSRQPLTETLPR